MIAASYAQALRRDGGGHGAQAVRQRGQVRAGAPSRERTFGAGAPSRARLR